MSELNLQVTKYDTILSPRFTLEEETDQLNSFERINNFDATSLLLHTSPSSKQNLHRDHPPPEIMLALWDYYSIHVDRMAKVLYKPEIQALVNRASRNISSVTMHETPLLYAIW